MIALAAWAPVPAVSAMDQVWIKTMTVASTVKDRATAPIVKVQVRSNTMIDNPHDQVNCLMRQHQEQITYTQEVEGLLMKVLWDLRGTVKVDDMLRWTGWSKQTLYNKWAKYGLKENNENIRAN